MTNLEYNIHYVVSISYFKRWVGLLCAALSLDCYLFQKKCMILKEMVDSFAIHLERVYELEMFYVDETLGALMEHARSFNEQLRPLEYIYGLSKAPKTQTQTPKKKRRKESLLTKDHENAIIRYCETNCVRERTETAVD